MHKSNIVVLSFLLAGIMLGAIGMAIYFNILSGQIIPPGSGAITPSRTPTQIPLPFPLDDMGGDYRLLEQGQNTYILSYTAASGTRQDIYADPSQLSDYRDYLNSSILVKGYMKTIKKQVQCFRAPCDPIEQQVLVITRLQLKPQPMMPITSTSPAKDQRCYQKITFTGNCKMYITSTEYDETKNECVSVGGGGCRADTPFASENECRRLCIDSSKNLTPSPTPTVSKKTQCAPGLTPYLSHCSCTWECAAQVPQNDCMRVCPEEMK